MKVQDIFFLVLVVLLVFLRKRRLFVYSGIFFLLAAMPLYRFWIFFTAQRFVMYAWILLLVSLFSPSYLIRVFRTHVSDFFRRIFLIQKSTVQ